MSQYGMQMPGGQLQRGPIMNVYTALLGVAAVALLVACVYVLIQAMTIGHDGSPFEMHPYDATKKVYDVKLAPDAQ